MTWDMTKTTLSRPIFPTTEPVVHSWGPTFGPQGPESESSLKPPDFAALRCGFCTALPSPRAPFLGLQYLSFHPRKPAPTCPPASTLTLGRAIPARGFGPPLHTRGNGVLGCRPLAERRRCFCLGHTGATGSRRCPPAATLLTKLIGPQSFSSSTFCSATFSETPSTLPTGEEQLGKSPCKRPAPHTGVPPRRVRLPGAALGSGQGESAGRIARFQDAQQQKAIHCILHQPLRGTVYLDHAGATLFPQSQLTSFTKDLMENVYGNPHSQNSSSRLTRDTVEQVRYRILAHFHTSPEDYTVIFTAGSTAALKLVAEAFPWLPPGPESSGSHFCYLTDSHTSVVGMREVVAAMNITSIPVRPEDMWLAEEQDATAASDADGQPLHLFCYPAQSNFSGTRYPLSWIEEVKSGRMCPVGGPGKWFVLLDAAAYVGTSPLDLSVHGADFVPLSFYKIFGFPTGLGALLVNSRSAPLLRKTYFGGGTATAYLAEEDFYIPRESVAERFEDGTISFLDVIALKHGFDVLERLTGGMENIRQHTFTLARYTYAALSALRYPNGAPVVQIYSDSEFSSPEVQGPVISFNMLDDNGNIIGYSQVDKMASLHNIHVRTGCFCNTGACQRHLGISDEMVKKHLQAGHVCGDDVDLIDGQPTGSVRISFGYMSTLEDAQAFLRFIIATRLRPSHGQPLPLATPGEAGALSAESLPATRARRSPSPQEDASPDSRVWDNAPTTADAVSLRPPLLETTRTQQTPSEKAAGILDGSLGSHIVTNLFLYPIKSCAAFEKLYTEHLLPAGPWACTCCAVMSKMETVPSLRV
nr:molybdenum cofactor sulfurase isoform X11 [Globicephala melas]